MGEARATNPLVLQFRKGGVPRELRMMAAQGALPLKPEDLLELLVDLAGDHDSHIQETASKQLMAFPVPELQPIVKSRDTPPPVLSWVVTYRAEREVREVALQNPSLEDDVIETLSPTLPQELAELVVINQVRLLRRTSLLEALESNPNLSNDQKRRLRELRETFKIGEQPAPAAPAPPPAPEPEAELETFEDIPNFGATSEEDAMVRYLSDEERAQTEKTSVIQKLYRLNTAEKMITALKGSREERAVLVRDPNRLVATAVLGSPRLTEVEVEAFAGMKSVSDEILRQIGNHREWTKRYQVLSNLVHNPRTPLAISLGLVARLNAKDIKSISVDRNVPEAVRKQAQKFIKGPDRPGGHGKH